MRRILAALLAAVALAGCSSSAAAPKDQLTLEPSTTTTTTPAIAALAARLPAQVLDGFTRADAALGGGPLDLAAAGDASTDPDAERARLQRRNFREGVSRSWVAPNADTIYIAVYEFADTAGAAGYAADQAALLTEHGATPFPGGFTTVEKSGQITLTTHAAIRQVGNRWALVLVASEQNDRTPADATAIAASIVL
ncbi:MAG: hypothetical protein JWN29_1809 [Acidimicrobiales bacterium]|nr:hypothetical protein [Acidimicrobiales bacterium]